MYMNIYLIEKLWTKPYWSMIIKGKVYQRVWIEMRQITWKVNVCIKTHDGLCSFHIAEIKPSTATLKCKVKTWGISEGDEVKGYKRISSQLT